MKRLYFLFTVFVYISADYLDWDAHEGERFEEEKELASKYGLSGIPHYVYPPIYQDLSRRFVPNYPYREKSAFSDEVEKKDNIGSLIPLRASPELVLAVAEESAKLEALKPKEHLNQNILRSGKYWDSFWREDFDPDKLLRKQNNKATLNVIPNAELRGLIKTLRKMSPKLIYVINNNK